MKLRQVVVFVASTAVAGCARSADAPTNARLVRELARLETVQQHLEQSALPQLFAGMVAPNRQALETAAKTEDAALQLYRLRNAFTGIETLSFVAAHPAAGEKVEELAAVWEARRSTLETITPLARGSMLEKALSEAAANRAEKLFRASLPYGRVSGAASGLYYLAEAEANARFAAFVASEVSASDERVPKVAQLRAAIDALDADALSLFDKDPTSRDAIPASAALKEARELLDRGSLAGASLLAAEARLAIARRTPDATLEVAKPPAEGDSLLETFRAMRDPLVDRSVVPFLASLRKNR
jgi:hypothetical protein